MQKELDDGEIAGIIIGVVVAVVGVVLIVLCGCFGRYRYLKYYAIDDNKKPSNGQNFDSAL